MALCPTCFSVIGTWSDDPILTTPELSVGYPGFTQIKPTHIIELQNEYNLKEIESGLTPTVWTYIDNVNIYQVIKTCIIELRTAAENILTTIESDKYHFFNYDRDGIYMGTTQDEWHDVDLSSSLVQIKAIHIEDLRHPFPVFAYLTCLAVDSDGNIVDAAIYDESTYIGHSGVELTVSTGPHTIGATYGEESLYQSITLTSGEHRTITFTFSPIYGYVEVHNHNPEGKDLKAPYTLSLIPGSHVISDSFNGMAKSQTVNVIADETILVVFVYERIEYHIGEGGFNMYLTGTGISGTGAGTAGPHSYECGVTLFSQHLTHAYAQGEISVTPYVTAVGSGYARIIIGALTVSGEAKITVSADDPIPGHSVSVGTATAVVSDIQLHVSSPPLPPDCLHWYYQDKTIGGLSLSLPHVDSMMIVAAQIYGSGSDTDTHTINVIPGDVANYVICNVPYII